MKALLILVGGRPIPNILTIINEKPERIVAVCSHESVKDEWLQLKQAIIKLAPTSQIQETRTVDAFDFKDVKETCILAFLMYPEADWIFNATAATSLMTLGIYMAAEHCAKFDKASIECLYLDTGHSRTVFLIGEERDTDIFSINVEQYVGAYNYGLQSASSIKNYEPRYLQDDWMKFAGRLGKNLLEIDMLKQILQSKIKGKDNFYSILKEENLYRFLRELEGVELIRKFSEEGSTLKFYISEEQLKFLNGAWLELYVYQEAKSVNFFEDVRWSKEIIDNDPNRTAKTPLAFKEMDVAITNKAHFMIVECKTSFDSFDSKILDGIVTIADLVGRAFVTKVLVTSKSYSSTKRITDYEDFKTKAKVKGVQVFTLEDIPFIGDKLREQMEKSMRSRR